ncbi:MAG: cytochrome c peroxidase [Anaerolineae bacterium]|jgi:cytochrome c peroxidase
MDSQAGEIIDRFGGQRQLLQFSLFVRLADTAMPLEVRAWRYLVPSAWTLLLIAAILLGGCQGSPTGQALDQELRAAMGESGITPLDPKPSPEPAKVALGQALFFDKELSGNRDVSCATCHHPLFSTADGISLSIGAGGVGLGPDRTLGGGQEFIARNATDLFNRGSPEWTTMFWDNRVNGTPEIGFHSPAVGQLPPGLDSLLAAQALFPVASDEEMRGEPGDRDVFGNPNELAVIIEEDLTAIWDGLMGRLLAFPEYQDLFSAAYPDVPAEQLGIEHAVNAIAAFEIDAWTYLDSPWDLYVAGDDSTLTDGAKRGALLFYGLAGCAQCHSGNLLTDQETHNVAVPQLGPGKDDEAPLDIGRARVTNYPGDMFAFRTPPLRNVELTGPWMHNGAYVTLEGAVRHMLKPQESLLAYDPGQLVPDLETATHDDPKVIDLLLATLDPLAATPVELSDGEFDDLMAFLRALTAPEARDLQQDIPPSVPSGLAVED